MDKEKAELERINSEIGRNKAEEGKLIYEAQLAKKELEKKWFNARFFIEIVIGAIVAGAFFGAWWIGYIGPLIDKKTQLTEIKTQRVEEENKLNEIKLNQTIYSVRNEKEKAVRDIQDNYTKLEKEYNTLVSRNKELIDLLSESQDNIKKLEENVSLTDEQKESLNELSFRAQSNIINLESDIKALEIAKIESKDQVQKIVQNIKVGELRNIKILIIRKIDSDIPMAKAVNIATALTNNGAFASISHVQQNYKYSPKRKGHKIFYNVESLLLANKVKAIAETYLNPIELIEENRVAKGEMLIQF